MADELETQLSPLAGLVPQVFFDIIARIFPGAFLMFVGYFFAYRGPTNGLEVAGKAIAWFSTQEGARIVICLVLLMCSYLVSISLEGVYRQIQRHLHFPSKTFLTNQIDKAMDRTLKDFNNVHKCNLSIGIFPDISLMYDAIRMRVPAAGARLVKLRAEYHMARVTALGLVFVEILNFTFHGITIVTLIAGGIYALLMLTMMSTYVQRRQRYMWGLCNHWLIIKEKALLVPIGISVNTK